MGSALWWGVLSAQTAPVAPGIGDALKQTTPATPVPPAAPRPANPEIRQAPPAGLVPGADTLHVGRFRIDGEPLLNEAEVQQALAPWLAKDLSLADIEQAAARLTTLLREHGQLLARAYVPPQDARDGTVTLRIQQGRVGQWRLQNQSAVSDELLRRTLAGIQPGQTLIRPGLERSMLLVGDMPGAALPQVSIGPGAAPGTSDVSVAVPAGRRVQGRVGMDNVGSRLTGRMRLNAGLDINALSGWADQLSLGYIGSDLGDLFSTRVAYSSALSADGLRGELASSSTHYLLGKDYADLGAHGHAWSVEALLSKALVRSPLRHDKLAGGLIWRRMQDDFDVSDVHVPKQSWLAHIGLQTERWAELAGQPWRWQAEGQLSVGLLRITEPEQAALNDAGAQTRGHFGHLQLSLSGLWEPAPLWSLLAKASAQHTLGHKNLDPSEQFNIAGPEGVRAYPEALSGDNGHVLSVEAHRQFQAMGAAMPFCSAFADIGQASIENGAYTSQGGALLKDIGVGWGLRFKRADAQIQLARPIGGHLASVQRPSVRVLAQLTVSL